VRFAGVTDDPDLAPRAELAAPDLTQLVATDDAAFSRRYGDTAFARPGPAGMRRNAAAVTAKPPAP
jgi:epoxyqueuosine reductase QueG